MASSLNLSLTDELRRFVDSRTGDEALYSTPSEYIRDLIRRDMQDWIIARDIAQGIREAAGPALDGLRLRLQPGIVPHDDRDFFHGRN